MEKVKEMKEYFEFEIQLADVKPMVWRRFLLRSDSTFEDLHQAIQAACGWKNQHRYRFWTLHGDVIANKRDYQPLLNNPAGSEVTLKSFFTAGDENRRGPSCCVYGYGSGKWFFCALRARRRVVLPERFSRRMMGGRRAFPTEDCLDESTYEPPAQVNGDAGAEVHYIEDYRPNPFNLRATQQQFDR